MSYRQALDEAIGHSPVSTVDVDRVIFRQRRARRLRMWGAGGAGAAAVLAVTLTAGLLWGPQPSPAPPAIPPSPSVPPIPSHPPAPRITTVAGSEADWQRLEAAVEASLKRTAPSIKWPNSTAPGLDRPGWQSDGRSGWTTKDQFSVKGEIAADGKRGYLLLVVRRQGLVGFHSSRCERQSKMTIDCVEAAGPDGSRIRTSTMDMGSRSTPPLTVQMLRADNSAVTLTLSGHTSPGPLPLTVEQLITIATDPTLNLGPLPPGVEVPVQTLPPSAPADPAQQERLDKAVIAALRAQLPGVTSSAALEEAWTGSGGDNDRDNYWGQAPITNGKTRPALFSVQIWRKSPSFGSLTCGRPSGSYSCRKGEGPNGEQYRIATTLSGKGDTRTGERSIDVRRKDGSWLNVNHASGGTGPTFALTEQQQLAIALSSTLTLAPR
ncbi:hypothetical protein [Micromonospora sp. NBRC 101691]|uniref:hypothetical protein n=1 Tax=Micromonospora sp. NBRC 101691 TaxID=3032198 RepID=UPI0024A33080|nr:hypothetical protein [Micromonospora sp. NBRC 101691]GLY22545.1 hypothetical protein Misp04_22770 [Micromonospora sp. NBRC 101691]